MSDRFKSYRTRVFEIDANGENKIIFFSLCLNSWHLLFLKKRKNFEKLSFNTFEKIHITVLNVFDDELWNWYLTLHVLYKKEK